MPKVCTDEQFIELFQKLGATKTGHVLQIGTRSVFRRRNKIEEEHGIILIPASEPMQNTFAHRKELCIDNGVVIVGSDAHYWPDIVSTAHRAFVHACKTLKPDYVIQNGDVLDGAKISRHAPIGWENMPSLIDEIDACKQRLAEIVAASPKATHLWTLGNHCARFETRLATVVPEYAKLHGVHLKDHFTDWNMAWSVWINDDVVIKHRYKGGIHATHNNTVSSGKSMVTGHLHSLKVTPYDDYNSDTRYGVDTGTLAQKYGPQFTDYMEDAPRNWRAGFAVLTFKNGRLLWPEVVHVLDEYTGEVQFRGKIYHV